MTRPWHYRWLVEGTLAGAARPPDGDLGAVFDALRTAAIGAVVNLSEHPLRVPAWAELAVLHHPTRDYEAPSDLRGLCAFIERHRTATMVCCDAGFGRTGTVLAAWLIRAKCMSAAEAIKHVRGVYASEAVESDSQIEALTELEHTARGRTAG